MHTHVYVFLTHFAVHLKLTPHDASTESERRSVVSDSSRPHGLYSPWNSPDQNTGVCSLSLLQGIFPTQGSNPGLLHCTDSLPAESQGKPKNTRVGSLSLLQWTFPIQELNQGLPRCRQILYQLSYQGRSERELISKKRYEKAEENLHRV